MATIRMMVPGGIADSKTVNGRTYSIAANGTIDVPDFDALILEANGWQVSATHGVGTTAQRPAVPVKNMHYLDTTLGYVIRHDGKAWRNPSTGAVV